MVKRKWFFSLKTVNYIVVLLVIVGMAYPLFWMVCASLKTNEEIFRSAWALPQKFRFDNFVEAWKVGHFGKYFLNSVIVTSISVLIIVLISSMAAYAFARLEFKGRKPLFYMFLSGLVLPIQVLIIPLFIQFRDMNLLDTYLALIFPYISWGLAISIYVLRSFFLTIPRDIEDAAKIDGCSLFGIYWRIMLPLVSPALLTVAILNAANIWNEFLLAYLFMADPKMKTLPAGLFYFSSKYITDFRLIFGGLTITIIPILVFYFLFQKHMVEGLTMGAIK